MDSLGVAAGKCCQHRCCSNRKIAAVAVAVVVDRDSNGRDVTFATEHVKMNKQPEMKQCFSTLFTPIIFFADATLNQFNGNETTFDIIKT